MDHNCSILDAVLQTRSLSLLPPTLLLRGTDLHGPLIERMVELPMDIYEGRVNGEFKIKASDCDSWEFPEMMGLVSNGGATEGLHASMQVIACTNYTFVCVLGGGNMASIYIKKPIFALNTENHTSTPTSPQCVHTISLQVRCRGASLHFWDSPDDILGADMDLVFERDRMYLHGAQV